MHSISYSEMIVKKIYNYELKLCLYKHLHCTLVHCNSENKILELCNTTTNKLIFSYLLEDFLLKLCFYLPGFIYSIKIISFNKQAYEKTA